MATETRLRQTYVWYAIRIKYSGYRPFNIEYKDSEYAQILYKFKKGNHI